MRRQPLNMVLAAVIMVALVLAVWPWLGRDAASAPDASVVAGISSSPQEEPQELAWWRDLPPIGAMKETVQRPLFTSSRRPRLPSGQRQQRVAGLAGYVLAGVVIAGDTRIAMLRSRTGAGNLRVRTGDKVAGWTVTAIDSRSVTVIRDGEQRRIVAAK